MGSVYLWLHIDCYVAHSFLDVQIRCNLALEEQIQQSVGDGNYEASQSAFS